MVHEELVWFITWTTYGTWLQGDDRGFVCRVRDLRQADARTGHRVVHNQPRTPYDRAIPKLRACAEASMKGPPVWLTAPHAQIVCEQFHETANYRGWRIDALAIMSNHVHLVLNAPSATRSDDILRDLKSYASRALNREYPKPQSDTWWTQGGSRRILRHAAAVRRTIWYVNHQKRMLAHWSRDTSA